MKLLLTITFLIILVAVILYATGLYKIVNRSILVETMKGPVQKQSESVRKLDFEDKHEISLKLEAVGLHRSGILGDTGIATHLQRLENQEIDLQLLEQYVQDLQFLTRFTTNFNGPIPTSFWDVRTEEMTNKNWTEYSLVQQLTQAEWRPYLNC